MVEEKKRINASEKLFQVVLTMSFIVLSFICIFPFLNVFSISFSSSTAILSGEVTLWPVGWNFEAYERVIGNPGFVRSFFYTVFLTAVYTAIAMTISICAAYPLSRKELKGRNIIMMFIIFTMYFDGGIIPNYLIVRDVGLLDSMWALIIPCMLSAYNLIILRSFFSSIDDSIKEAAYLDGCSEMGILLKIVLPLSVPAIATLSLFYAITRWNGVGDAIFYISDPDKFPLQLKLREIIMMEQISQQEASQGVEQQKTMAESVKAASIIATTVPILLVYPFIQKYFTQGLMLGSVKG